VPKTRINMFHLSKIFESPADHHYFFGYFNTAQISIDSQRILALRVKSIGTVPGPSDTAEVGWFSLFSDSNHFHKIGETNAYNWQQGAMLQFLGPDYKDQICWNFFDDVSQGRWMWDTGRNRKCQPVCLSRTVVRVLTANDRPNICGTYSTQSFKFETCWRVARSFFSFAIHGVAQPLPIKRSRLN